MKNNAKLTLTAMLLIVVFTANIKECRAEYDYWFWDSLSDPFGAVYDIGVDAVDGLGKCIDGVWKLLFGAPETPRT